MLYMLEGKRKQQIYFVSNCPALASKVLYLLQSHRDARLRPLVARDLFFLTELIHSLSFFLYPFSLEEER